MKVAILYFYLQVWLAVWLVAFSTERQSERIFFFFFPDLKQIEKSLKNGKITLLVTVTLTPGEFFLT